MIKKPAQKRSVETKKKIKETARRLFSVDGYYKVTSNKIASEAGVPIGSFYNYFGNKKGLILELIKDFNVAFHQETFQQLERLIGEMDSPEKSSVILELMVKETVLSPHLADPFYRIIHALQFTEPEVLALSEEIRQVEIKFISKVLQQVHLFSPIQQLGLVAKIVHSNIENIALYIHHLGSSYEQEQLIQEATQMMMRSLFGKKA